MGNFDIRSLLVSIPGIIIGFTIHEYCHALAAYKLGDYSARDDGRLTLDPVKHIDPVGLLFIIIAGFGWAKPVQYNPRALSKPGRDKIIIAAAGPFSNLVLGALFILGIKLFAALFRGSPEFLRFAVTVLYSWGATNIGLFVFNMLPLPPLDGSHIFLGFINLGEETEARIMRVGSMVFFAVILIAGFTGVNILPVGKLVNAIIRLLWAGFAV
ncbi:MAG: site-2 protease family protein [Treponema sp.]|jgi:Zn-dependent protease|nr:site-2 protease family protein [Treponema sp.]